MSVHILHWIKEDLELKGDKLSNYSLLDLKSIMEDYNKRYNERIGFKL